MSDIWHMMWPPIGLRSPTLWPCICSLHGVSHMLTPFIVCGFQWQIFHIPESSASWGHHLAYALLSQLLVLPSQGLPVTHCLTSQAFWIEASITSPLLGSACLQNQHHIDNVKVCHNLRQYNQTHLDYGRSGLWVPGWLNTNPGKILS
jgi:hypothetical protein